MVESPTFAPREEDARVSLAQQSGPGAPREFILSAGEHLIGRSEHVSVRLDSEDVSRVHARLRVQPGETSIVDLGSKNGIRIGADTLLHQRGAGCQIRHGDQFTIGDCVFELRDFDVELQETLAREGSGGATRTLDHVLGDGKQRATGDSRRRDIWRILASMGILLMLIVLWVWAW